MQGNSINFDSWNILTTFRDWILWSQLHMDDGNDSGQPWCLLQWIAQLHELPLEAVFVFDGPEAPARVTGPFMAPFPDTIVAIFESMIIGMGFRVCKVRSRLQ